MTKIKLSEEEWKQRLTPEQYNVLRKKETEFPFSGKLLHHKEKGVYCCAGCGEVLFSSKTKYESHSGWPSFFEVLDTKKIELKNDHSFGMERIEVVCGTCGGHLGHLFNDGPKQDGKHYCINSAALKFKKK